MFYGIMLQIKNPVNNAGKRIVALTHPTTSLIRGLAANNNSGLFYPEILIIFGSINCSKQGYIPDFLQFARD